MKRIDYLKRTNLGRRWLKLLEAELAKQDSLVFRVDSFNLDAADCVFSRLSSLPWTSNGVNAASLSKLSDLLRGNFPELFEFLGASDRLVVLPTKYGCYTGPIVVISDNPILAISKICEIDEFGCVLLDSLNEEVASFAFDFDTKTIAVREIK